MLAGKPGGSISYDAGKVDGPGATARFSRPAHLAKLPGGDILVTDYSNHLIRRVAPDGWVTTVAGNPGGAGKADGRGSAASFDGPLGIDVGADGGAWICDYHNHRIRRMDADGNVTTVAGNNAGATDGVGSGATFREPYGISMDASGAAIVGDAGNHRIRRVTAAGVVTTIAGSNPGWVDGPVATARFHTPVGVDVGPHANIWIADAGNNAIRKVSPNGTVFTVAGRRSGNSDSGSSHSANFNFPAHVVVSDDGVLYISDMNNHRIRARYPDGRVRTIAGDTAGVTDGIGKMAGFNGPLGLLLDDGDLLVADYRAHELRRIKLARKSCNDSQPCTTDRCDDALGCLFAPRIDGASCHDGKPCTTLSVCKSGVCSAGKPVPGCVCKAIAGGGCDDANPCTVDDCEASKGCRHIARAEGRPCDDGSVCTTNERCDNGSCRTTHRDWSSWRWAGSTGAQFGDGWRKKTVAGQAVGGFSVICGTDLDAAGTLWFADCGRHSVRKMTTDGTITTVAGPNAVGLIGDTDGPSTAARFWEPQDVSAAFDGSVYVADRRNNRIRRVDSAADVTTIAGQKSSGYKDAKGPAARFNGPTGVTVDPVGNVYVADQYNRRIRRIAPDGQVTTLAGNASGNGRDGSGAQASFYSPFDVDLTPQGDLIVVDGTSLRRVTTSGEVTTIVHHTTGAGGTGFGVYAVQLSGARRVDVAKDGAIFFVDETQRRVRRISAGGLISVIAGGGTNASVDGLGVKASLHSPRSVNLRSDGRLYVTSYNGGWVQLLEHGDCDDHNRCTLDVCDAKKGCSHKSQAAKAVCADRGPCLPATCDAKVGHCVWQALANGTPCGATCDQVCSFGTCAAAAVVSRWLGDGVNAFKAGPRASARLTAVAGMAEDKQGNLYLSDASRHVIAKVDKADQVSLLAGKNGIAGYQEGTADGTIAPLAGSLMGAVDGLGPDVRLNHPMSVLRRANGTLLVGTLAGRVVEVRRDLTSCAELRGISAAQPATSCQQIAKTKAYTDIETVWIDADGKGGGAPWKTTCDLTSAGGGWTQITAQTSATQVNTLLGGKGEVMFKCSLGGEAFLRSPVTSATWSWSKKSAIPGDWTVQSVDPSKGTVSKQLVACGAKLSFNAQPCGWGFGCAAGKKATDAFLLPGLSSGNQCADTTTLFTGGPMTICTKPSGGGVIADTQHKGWRVFVRGAP